MTFTNTDGVSDSPANETSTPVAIKLIEKIYKCYLENINGTPAREI